MDEKEILEKITRLKELSERYDDLINQLREISSELLIGFSSSGPYSIKQHILNELQSYRLKLAELRNE